MIDIIRELPTVYVAAFALFSRYFYHILGTRYFESLKTERRLTREFLELLQRDEM